MAHVSACELYNPWWNDDTNPYTPWIPNKIEKRTALVHLPKFPAPAMINHGHPYALRIDITNIPGLPLDPSSTSLMMIQIS